MFSFIDPSLIGAYMILAVALALSPRADVFFVVANSIQTGSVGGWASAAGIGAGSILHAIAAAIGVSAALAASPIAFSALQIVGAMYLFYLGVTALIRLRKKRASPTLNLDLDPLLPFEMFKRGLILNVSNPKVVIFYLALLPQFVNAKLGSVWLQIISLGTIHNIIGMIFLFTIAALSGWVSDWLRQTKIGVWLDRFAAIFFIGLAFKLATGTIEQ